MKKLVAAITTCLALGMIFAKAEPHAVIDDSKAPSFLVTLASKSGKFAEDTLTLKGVPLVVYFSVRPYRVSGHMDLETFVEQWDRGLDDFKDDPPNAELAIYDEGGDTHAVLILSKPLAAKETISFKVNVKEEAIPQSFGHATLFIDNFRAVGGR